MRAGLPSPILVLFLALVSVLLSSAETPRAQPQPPSDSAAEAPQEPGAWIAHTTIAERVHRGSKTVIVRDCNGIKVGGRVRLSRGRTEEEEGSVAALSCPSPGAANAPTAAANDEAPCDLAALGWVSPDGLDGGADDAETPLGGAQAASLPPRCQRLLAAAARVPGLAESYRSAKRTSDKLRGGAPMQPEDVPASSGSSHGDATPHAAPVAGVITLAAATLFEHAPEASVHASARLSGEGVAAATVAALEATSCALDVHGAMCGGAGKGQCTMGACACEAGLTGSVCELSACDDGKGCGPHGTCTGFNQCECEEGFEGDRCQRSSCAGGCSPKGTCLAGVCSCSVGWHGQRCHMHSQAACADSCGGVERGSCSLPSTGGFEPICLCKSKFVGMTCLTSVGDCGTDGCNGGGVCGSDSVCSCYDGYAGTHCETITCQDNCTVSTHPVSGVSSANGRCSASAGCICKDGFSGAQCNVECPSRCHGHGECTDGACTCRDGYGDYDCSKLVMDTYAEVLMGGLQGFYPVLLVTLVALMALILFCLVGYVVNRWRGRFGTAAIPMWEYYAKTWRNAPLFEPIFAVSAATQTPPPPKQANAPLGRSSRASRANLP